MLSVNDKLSDTDAVGIGRKGTIDKPLYLKAPFWTVDTLFYCTSKENSDIKFIYLLFQIINWKRYDESTGVPSLSKNTISSIKTYVPKVKEQDHISKLFFSLDNTLQLHERKCEELALIKKALLQKLFPKKDEFKPEVRYKNFSDAWEQRKLGEVAKKITKGTTPHDKSWSGPVNYVKTESIDSNNGNISVVANTSLEEHEGYLKRSQLKENDVLFSIVGTLGRVGVVKKKDLPANTNQQICIIRPFEENSFFLLNALKTNRVKSFIKSDATIGAQPSLSLWQIEGLRIPFPILEEQQKISAFFIKLDSLITLHQRKLERLKQLKKFLLQNMFI